MLKNPETRSGRHWWRGTRRDRPSARWRPMMIRPAQKRQSPRKVSTGNSLSASLSIGQLTPQSSVNAASRRKPRRGSGSTLPLDGGALVTCGTGWPRDCARTAGLHPARDRSGSGGNTRFDRSLLPLAPSRPPLPWSSRPQEAKAVSAHPVACHHPAPDRPVSRAVLRWRRLCVTADRRYEFSVARFRHTQFAK